MAIQRNRQQEKGGDGKILDGKPKIPAAQPVN